MTALYNEIDPFAAKWLAELSAQKHIAPGRVDTRSITELQPEDIYGATQFHTFAGIGVWSYALQQAGWPDDRQVWTGSCPCQPFSVAGKGKGTADERHLWPEWYRLIGQCLPAAVFGEQVASPAGWAWLDDVQADLENAGYAFGAASLCAAGVGAPHLRQRLYFVGIRTEGGLADADKFAGRQGSANSRRRDSRGDAAAWPGLGSSGESVGLADASKQRHDRRRSGEASDGRDTSRLESERLCDAGRLANASGARPLDTLSGERNEGGRQERDGSAVGGATLGLDDSQHSRLEGHSRHGDGDGGPNPTGPTPTSGLWSNPAWVWCRDGKYRPIEPGTTPLVTRAPARVGRLRGYGNALNAECATTFIKAVMGAA